MKVNFTVGFVCIASAIFKYNSYTCIKECLFAKSFKKNIKIITGSICEYCRVGLKGYSSACFIGVSYNFKVIYDVTAFISLFIEMCDKVSP